MSYLTYTIVEWICSYMMKKNFELIILHRPGDVGVRVVVTASVNVRSRENLGIEVNILSLS